MNFDSKQEYLTWRTEWRTSYRELSARIREAKLDNKKLARSSRPADAAPGLPQGRSDRGDQAARRVKGSG